MHGSLPSHEMKQRDGKIFLSDDFSHCYSRDEEIGRKRLRTVTKMLSFHGTIMKVAKKLF